MKRAGRLETMRRIQEVYQWLKQGLYVCDIHERTAAKYGIRTSQSEKLIYRARELLQTHFEQSAKGQLPDILSKLDNLAHKAEKAGDLSTARQSQMDKSKLLGLIKNTVDMNVNDERDYEATDVTILEEAVRTEH